MQENFQQNQQVTPAQKLNKKLLILILVIAGIAIVGYFVAAKTQNWWPFANSGQRDDGQICIQVITRAKNPKTGEIKDFPTPCDVPEGWEVVSPSDMINEDMEQKWTQEQQKAISIAQAELLKHYPNRENFGINYEVKTVERWAVGPADDKVWTVNYYLPFGPTDTDVLIVVDIEKNKVLSIHKPGA